MALRVLISGGGTGGHIYPGIALADELVRRDARNEIAFVGAEGKMEMDRVPKAGYSIQGLPIRGIERRMTSRNFRVPFLLAESIWKARGILKKFRPDVVVGTGGYASAAVGWTAAKKGIPLLVQEQNSYAGLTNRWLSGDASAICVAYPKMETYFPEEKIRLTGNPLRGKLQSELSREEALRETGLAPEKTTLLVMGGSGGAKTINKAMLLGVERILERGHQVIWQTGKAYYSWVKSQTMTILDEGLKIVPFIDDMTAAYAGADLVVSRAGALTISEISLLHLPALLIPSPNVAEDHQTSNAKALAEARAAALISDAEAKNHFTREVLALLENEDQRKQFATNIRNFAFPKATETITDMITELANSR